MPTATHSGRRAAPGRPPPPPRAPAASPWAQRAAAGPTPRPRMLARGGGAAAADPPQLPAWRLRAGEVSLSPTEDAGSAPRGHGRLSRDRGRCELKPRPREAEPPPKVDSEAAGAGRRAETIGQASERALRRFQQACSPSWCGLGN